MNLMALPDDPSRVASPHQGPCEYEPPDPPTISRDEALRNVRAVLFGSPTDAAYGWSKAEWLDFLWDDLSEDGVSVLLALAYQDECLTPVRDIGRRIGDAIERRVNELVAEMDPEELEMMR